MLLPLFALILLLASTNALYAGQPVLFENGKATIVLEDHIQHPLYWWPETLLSYEIVSSEPITTEQLELIDQKTGKQIPFQLTKSAIQGKAANTLHILTDLPSKGKQVFVLRKGEPHHFPALSVKEADGYIAVTTHKFSVRIPASQSVVDGKISGPVACLSEDGINWFGQSAFAAGTGVKSLETKQVNSGPLFATFELHYTFSNGAAYTAQLRCIQGYDFIELKEQMEGFKDEERPEWSIHWNKFAPTHRQAPNHPYGKPKENAKGFNRYDWESISQTMLNSHHGINKEVSADGKIPFQVGLFGNWPAETNVTSSLFWDEKSNRSIGIFTQDLSYWDDRQYAIWHDPRDLSVKFFYKDSLLKWSYPLINGNRSTALSFYPHQKDIDYMDNLESLTELTQTPDGLRYNVKMAQLSYNSFLQNKHSTLDLNKVKDWCLVYPDSAPIPVSIFDDSKKQSVRDFEQRFLYGSFTNELAISGPCQNSGYGPTASRSFYDMFTSSLNQLLPRMTKDQRDRMIAMFLVHAYIAAGEEYMPMKHILSGHPNFLSDVKSVPAFASYLFPEHPQAKEWADLFEKYIDLNSHYHTRPDVKRWNAIGGRWTENINTYIWGFIRPAIRANYLLHLMDGKKRMANKNMTKIGNYVMNALSAPFDGGSTDVNDMHNWGSVTPENGPARVIPPLGAHAIRRMLPSAYWLLGKEFEHYDPLLSENMRYIARPEYEDAEMKDRAGNTFNCMYPLSTDDSGTPPDLESVKITGYGIVLRSSVGTKDELSVHLGQIDNGPNYRWGIVGDGGCGAVYFYARGKSYSNNGKEDAGDRRLQDTDLVTSFGVFKDGRFKSIGKNELSSPLYDLTVGQYAEITSSSDRAYSWPEYKGRSIMLVGSDYFLIYDDVYNQNMGSRFSWFTKLDESLPELEVIKGGGADYTYSSKKAEYITHTGKESKGIWFDGTGDFLTFVSHKKGYTSQPTSYGSVIHSPEGNSDFIFRNDIPVEVDEADIIFTGTAGLIRNKPDQQEMVVFHGSRIGNADFEIYPQSTDAGLSAIYKNKENIKGQFYCIDNAQVVFKWNKGMPRFLHFYIDGVKQHISPIGNEMRVTIPAGKHIWNLTKGLPNLPRPVIQYTRNDNNKVEVCIVPVAGTESYRYEYSTDAGKNWTLQKEQPQNKRVFSPQGKESKGYIRVSALNKEHTSAPSVIYPMYFTSAKPHYPDGLKLEIMNNRIELSWGKVLGCKDYKLYKKTGNGPFRLIHSGNDNEYTDNRYSAGEYYEYTVSTLNGNGESELCQPVTTNPDSWLNFDPVKGEPFRRTVTLKSSIDNDGNRVPSYYPE